MRRMTGHTVLLNRGVLPQKRASFLRVALIAEAIGRAGLKHFWPFSSSMRVMTSGATYFHNPVINVTCMRRTHGPVLCTEHVCRALEEGLSLFSMAAQTRILDGEVG